MTYLVVSRGIHFHKGLWTHHEEEFSQKLKILEEWWNELEKAHNAQVRFYDWFIRNKSTIIVQTMIKPVHEEAGLGSPP